MESGKKVGVGGIIASIIFLIWFFASIGAMIYFSQKNMGPLIVVVFGQFFLVFGGIAIFSGIKTKSFQPVTLLFPVVGIGCIIGGCIFQFGNETVAKYAYDASVVIGTYFSSKRRHEVCTYCISATIVEVKSHYHKGTRSYCPIYEVYFRDEMIQLCNNTFTNMHHFEVGETREIYLNPNNPTEFFEPREEKTLKTFLYILGSAFVAVSAFALVMILFVIK